MVAMDTEDGLIYEEKPFHGIKVKAATIDKLVTYCLDQFGKQYSYILIHYMSLVSFCTPPPPPCPLKTFFFYVFGGIDLMFCAIWYHLYNLRTWKTPMAVTVPHPDVF